MKECTTRLSLDELLTRPNGLLALRGRDEDKPSGSEVQDEDENDESEEDDENESDENDDKDKSKGKKAAPSAHDRQVAALTEEKQRFYDQRNDARKEIKTLQTEIAKLKKDGTPDDALKGENETLTTANATLAAANQSLMLENAFLKATGFDWVDPEAAMALADLSKVEFDEKTNRAIGLESALQDLAKKKPFLLKPKDNEEDEDKGARRTGRPPRPGSQRQANAAQREAALRAKYPGLRR